MCGICGIINFDKSTPIEQEKLVAMRDTMIHRGPDSSGVYIDKGVGLGFRRLSILDLSAAGNQPMSNEDSNIYIVYNGEFYNFEDYKPKLIANGHSFKSCTDTEVIIHLFEEYGIEKTISRINGMFAFCLWDKKKDTIYLVRDRFGIKPLYYTQNKNRIAFASEIKAFYKLPDYSLHLVPEAVPEVFLFNRTLDNSTLLQNTFEVLPGTYLKINRDRIETRKYYDLSKIEVNSTITETQAMEEFERLFTLSVKRRLISDVPVGVFLSGGLDSSLIAVIMAELSDKPIQTISAGYEEESANEFRWSDQLVELIRSNHRNFVDDSSSFFSLQPYLSYIYDAPLQTGVAFYKAARFAKETCTAMLCGQGSDEIFGGYTSYLYAEKQAKLNHLLRFIVSSKGTKLLQNILPKLGKRKIFRKVGARIHLSDEMIAAAYGASMPRDDFINSIHDGSGQLYEQLLMKYTTLIQSNNRFDFLHKMLLTEMLHGLQNIVQNTDRMTMAASVETRVPFLDHELVEFVFSLPTHLKIKNGIGKYLMKKYMKKYFSNDFIYRKKQGFPVPLFEWFVDSGEKLIMPVLQTEEKEIDRFFNKDYLQKYSDIVMSEAMGRHSDSLGPIWRYFTLRTWWNTLEEYID